MLPIWCRAATGSQQARHPYAQPHLEQKLIIRGQTGHRRATIHTTMTTPRVTQAIDAMAAGLMVIVLDDADREDEADLVMAAEHVTPDAINFMAREGRGLICVAMTADRLDELELPPMVNTKRSTALHQTAFTVSVDAIKGTTTGISAYDRALTIRALVAPDTRPCDLARPGHLFPLRAHPDGVLGRRGQTEAGVDLARLGGHMPAAVICEIMARDGTMARGKEVERFAAHHRLHHISVGEVADYRRAIMEPASARVRSEPIS